MNKKVEITLIYILFLISSFGIAYSFNYTMADDGWRHLAMAFYPNEIGSWGRVFDHTLYGEFDPWFMWHKLLYVISLFSGKEYTHIVVNAIIYFLLSNWFYIMLRRHSTLSHWMIIILSIYLPMTCARYFYLRADLLSGLFLLYFILIDTKKYQFILSMLYAPMYYVFWFYFGYLGLTQLILKQYKSIIIIIISIIFGFSFYMYIDMDGYINVIKNVINNDYLTQGHFVSESQPYLIPNSLKTQFGSGIILIFFLFFFSLVYYILKPKSKPLYYLLLFAPLMFLQIRFTAILFPLVELVLIIYVYKLYEMINKYGYVYVIDLIFKEIKQRSYFGDISAIWYKRIFAIGIIIYFISVYNTRLEYYNSIDKSFENLKFLQNEEFKNKKIMITKMGTLMYMSVYINPTASYVPGCSLGWVDYNDKYKKLYFKVVERDKNLTVKEFFDFVHFNDIDYIVIQMHLNKLEISQKVMSENGFKFYKLFENNIIFKKIML